MNTTFCPMCGAALRLVVPPGDDHERLQCSACGHIHYVNPEVHVGCIVCGTGAVHEPELLLAQTGRGEKVQAAVLRALRPVAVDALALREEDLALFAAFTDASSQRLYLVFRVPGECVQARAAAAAPAPWAAPLLALFATEREAGRFNVHTGHFDGARLALRAVPTDRGEE